MVLLVIYLALQFAAWLIKPKALEWLNKVPKIVPGLACFGLVVGGIVFLWRPPMPAFASGQIGVLVARPESEAAQLVNNAITESARGIAPRSARERVAFHPIRPLPSDPTLKCKEAAKLGKRSGAAYIVEAVPIPSGFAIWLIETSKGHCEPIRLGSLPGREDSESRDSNALTRLVASIVLRSAESSYAVGDVAIAFDELKAIVTGPLATSMKAADLNQAWIRYCDVALNTATLDKEAKLRTVIADSTQSLTVERDSLDRSIRYAVRGLAEMGLRNPEFSRAVHDLKLAADGLREYRGELWALLCQRYATALLMTEDARIDSVAEQSMKYARVAASYYASEGNWKDHAAAQFTIAQALSSITTGNRRSNLQRSIDLYRETAQFYSREKYPFEWASIMNNIGRALYEIAAREDMESLIESKKHLERALEVRTSANRPLEYAATMHNLGLTLALLDSDNGGGTDRALRCMEHALRLVDLDTYPRERALIQFDLGNTLYEAGRTKTAQDLSRIRSAWGGAIPLLEKFNLSGKARSARSKLAILRQGE